MSIAGYIEPEDRKSATLILDRQVGEVEGSAIKSTSLHCCEPVLKSQVLHAFKNWTSLKKYFILTNKIWALLYDDTIKAAVGIFYFWISLHEQFTAKSFESMFGCWMLMYAQEEPWQWYGTSLGEVMCWLYICGSSYRTVEGWLASLH